MENRLFASTAYYSPSRKKLTSHDGGMENRLLSTFPKFILPWGELLSLLFHWSYQGDKNKIFFTVKCMLCICSGQSKNQDGNLGLPFDIKKSEPRVFLANEKWHFENQTSQKHVKMPQILQNTNRYSNESSRLKELICLKDFSGKWKIGIFKTNFAAVKRSLIKRKKIAVVKRSLRDKYVSFSLEIRSYSVEYLCNFFKLRTICSIVNYAVLT